MAREYAPAVHLIDVSSRALELSRAHPRRASPTCRVVGHERPTRRDCARPRRAAGRGRAAGALPRLEHRQLRSAGRARRCCAQIRAALRPGDALLLGADLVKPERELLLGLRRSARRHGGVQQERAAADQHRARRRLRSRELRAPGASGTPPRARVEMHLVSRARRPSASRAPTAGRVRRGEWIWTESSYKFRPAGSALGARAGLAGRTVGGRCRLCLIFRSTGLTTGVSRCSPFRGPLVFTRPVPSSIRVHARDCRPAVRSSRACGGCTLEDVFRKDRTFDPVIW